MREFEAGGFGYYFYNKKLCFESRDMLFNCLDKTGILR
jgi:hypothetical protein